MGKLTGVQKMEELFQKAESIREQYAEALQNAENEVTELTEAIAEGEQHVQEIYKNYVLGIVALDAYSNEKKILDDKKAVLQIAQQKIADIDELMKGELYEVYREAKELTGVGGAFRVEELRLIEDKRKEISRAKRDYLKLIEEIAKEVISVQRHNVWFSHLEIELGIKEYNHTSNVNPKLFQANKAYNRAGAEVSGEDVENAYVGKISYVSFD